LAALAFIDLVLGDDSKSGSGLPDVTVIIDAETLLSGRAHAATVCDIGLGRFGLPVETIRRWACLGTVTPVVAAAEGVRIMLGRETRVANRAQRRALRVLYRSCVFCEVPFDNCQVHHVDWYSLGGLTDINRLIPVCNKHHHLIHEGGWKLDLATDRTLTVTQPGGNVFSIGPPTIRAA
jgi:hypothetical protein